MVLLGVTSAFIESGRVPGAPCEERPDSQSARGSEESRPAIDDDEGYHDKLVDKLANLQEAEHLGNDDPETEAMRLAVGARMTRTNREGFEDLEDLTSSGILEATAAFSVSGRAPGAPCEERPGKDLCGGDDGTSIFPLQDGTALQYPSEEPLVTKELCWRLSRSLVRRFGILRN